MVIRRPGTRAYSEANPVVEVAGMGSDLRRRAAGTRSAVHTAEFIVSSARLSELHECAALLRRARLRAEEIVDEARALAAEAGRAGESERAALLAGQAEEAHRSYCKVLDAYMLLTRRINEERAEILQAQLERDKDADFSEIVRVVNWRDM